MQHKENLFQTAYGYYTDVVLQLVMIIVPIFLNLKIILYKYYITQLIMMFPFTHPLIAQGAGRIKTDPINQQRIQKVLDRYEEWSAKNVQVLGENHLNYYIGKDQVQKSLFIFPAAGAAIGALSTMTFVHPNSKYIGKFFTLFTTYLGYCLHQRYQQSYNVSRYFGNFPAYPKDIQRMIDNNDARYAFRWLKDDYLQIQASN